MDSRNVNRLVLGVMTGLLIHWDAGAQPPPVATPPDPDVKMVCIDSKGKLGYFCTVSCAYGGAKPFPHVTHVGVMEFYFRPRVMEHRAFVIIRSREETIHYYDPSSCRTEDSPNALGHWMYETFPAK